MAKVWIIAGRRTEVRRGTLPRNPRWKLGEQSSPAPAGVPARQAGVPAPRPGPLALKRAARCLAILVLLRFGCPAQQTAAIAVEEAVAPAYPAAAVAGGHASLRQACLEAARLWRFSAQPASRDVKLTFLFRLMPKNTPEAQLGAVFRPPYTVEVRKIAAEKVTHYARDGSEAEPSAPPERDRPPG